MAWSEIEGFVAQFKSLLLAGKDAKLTLCTDAGKESVIFEVSLHNGKAPTSARHRPPSYYRRQVKRREKRNKSNETAVTKEGSNKAIADEAIADAPCLLPSNLLISNGSQIVAKNVTKPFAVKSGMCLPTETTSSLKSHCLQVSDPLQIISKVIPAVNSLKPVHQPSSDPIEFNSRCTRTNENVSILKPNSTNFPNSLISSCSSSLTPIGLSQKSALL